MTHDKSYRPISTQEMKANFSKLAEECEKMAATLDEQARCTEGLG